MDAEGRAESVDIMENRMADKTISLKVLLMKRSGINERRESRRMCLCVANMSRLAGLDLFVCVAVGRLEKSGRFISCCCWRCCKLISALLAVKGHMHANRTTDTEPESKTG